MSALSGEEIRRNLAEFAARWGGYSGSERAEAQTFLTQLLACYGTDRQEVGARFEDPTAGGGFMDMVWPRVCIFEMKRPSEAGRLEQHREQALAYWRDSGTPAVPAPRYVVLCAFHRFEVWEPGAVYNEPRAAFDLAELPEHLDALLFLAGREPYFARGQAELTREAVSLLTDFHQRLRERRAGGRDELTEFVLQIVWSLFAEDLQLLPSHMFTRIVEGLLEDERRSSADDLGQLFRHLAEPGERPQHGMYAGAPYVDGGLFAVPRAVHSSARSWSSCAGPATSTGSRSSRRSSDRSSRARSGASASGRSAPTTPRRPTSSRSSCRRSSIRGASGSRPPHPRRRRGGAA